MNKVKIRCSVCGKSFKTPSPKKTVCPACDAAAKRAKHQSAPAQESRPVPAATSQVDVRAALRAGQENQGQFAAYRAPTPPPAPVAAQAATHAAHSARGQVQGARPDHRPGQQDTRLGHKAKAPRPEPRPATPRPPREPKPRVQKKPFEPTPEQIEAIRTRYLELAQPEFDGIRHQIAHELGIPLRVVKQTIKEVRAQTSTASWWENGNVLPSPEQIEQVRALYVPLLPEPAIGVHKLIAKQLKLTNTSVYQAIGHIRDEMNLPRYTERATTEDEEPVLPPTEAEVAVHAEAAAGE